MTDVFSFRCLIPAIHCRNSEQAGNNKWLDDWLWYNIDFHDNAPGITVVAACNGSNQCCQVRIQVSGCQNYRTMIHFVVTPEHRYTLRHFLRRKQGAPCRTITYRWLFKRKSLPGGTYIFTDIERLMPWERHLAAEIAGRLMQAEKGFRVMNDPARVKTRIELLHALYESGINRFRAYRADEPYMPERYPVFIRMEQDHDMPLTGLVHSLKELRASLQHLRETRYPMNGLIIVEYMAEPFENGLFRKYATFRIGDHVISHHHVIEDNWNVKYGTAGVSTRKIFEEEQRFVEDNQYEAVIRRAFDIGNIDFGRADFGIVDSEPQVYEINTNPNIPGGSTKRLARLRTMMLGVEKLHHAIDAVDTLPVPGTRCRLDGNVLALYRRKNWYLRKFIVRGRP